MMYKGFTLVETVVVLALISIVSGVLVLSFFSAQNDNVMEEAKVMTVTALESARNRAVTGIGEEDHGVRMTKNDNKIEVFTINEAGEKTVFRVISLPRRIEVDNTVDFIFKRITGDSEAGAFKLKSNITEEEVKIEVKESGSIKIINIE